MVSRRALIVVLAALTVAPLVAQAPKGWKLRVDRSTSASDPDAAGTIKFMQMGSMMHAVNPQAAVYWNPSNTASGNYTLKGTFTQNARSSHPNFIGFVFGGKDLGGPNENYTYFLVAPQGGAFLVKQRTGTPNTATKDVVPRTPSPAVAQLDASGKATNTLEVRVLADKIDYVVNGMVVSSTPKAGINTDGIWGMRVNHALPDVSITGLSVSK